MKVIHGQQTAVMLAKVYGRSGARLDPASLELRNSGSCGRSLRRTLRF